MRGLAEPVVPFGSLVDRQIKRRGKRKRLTVNRAAYRRAYARALYALRDEHQLEFHELLEATLAEVKSEEAERAAKTAAMFA